MLIVIRLIVPQDTATQNLLYRVYYAAFEKDSNSTGAPPTPYKIVDVKFEPAPAVIATEASVQQQQPNPTTNSVSSASQNTIPSAGVTSLYPVPRSQPTEPSPSIYQPPVSRFHPPSIPEPTQAPQPVSNAPPFQPTVSSSYQSPAPPPGAAHTSTWNDPPVVVKTKKVIVCYNCYHNYY